MTIHEYKNGGGKVYVANVTAQNHQLNFSLPSSTKPMSIAIPMGGQRLVGELSTPEIDAMVRQLGPYGLVEHGQASKREKVTYLFNVGGVVPADAIRRTYERNRGILRDEGAERRQQAATAAAAAMNTDETPLKNAELSVEEVKSGDLGSESDKVGEGFRVDNENAPAPEGKKPRRRSPRASE